MADHVEQAGHDCMELEQVGSSAGAVGRMAAEVGRFEEHNLDGSSEPAEVQLGDHDA